MSDEVLVKNIDMDLSDVSAAPPLLDKQTLRVKVGEAGVKVTDKGLKRMVIPLILEEPGRDTKGEPVQVGFRVTHSFLLDESGGWTKKRAAEELLRSKMAILRIDESTAKSTPHNFEEWVGKEVLATFSVKGENQNVSRLNAVK
jgi:hypothetical protein